MTAFTVIISVGFVLITVATIAILVMTNGYRGYSDRVLRIMALVVPLIGVALDASYHVLVDLGYQVPEWMHTSASAFLFVGVYYILRIRLFGKDNTGDSDESSTEPAEQIREVR